MNNLENRGCCDTSQGVKHDDPGEEMETNPPEIHAYKTRWFILFVLSILILSNSMSRIAFGPVAYTSAAFYETEIEVINWFAIVYMVVGIPSGIVATWIMDRIGLRYSLLLSSWLHCVGSVLRVISAIENLGYTESLATVFAGHILSGIAQPFLMFAPTKVAALWFPDNQRALANTIATSSNPLGIMTANILSPVIVKTPKDILTMLIVYACPAVLGAILVSAGVRQSRPSLPPSASAETEPEPFWMGIKKLLSNRQYWLIFLCIGGGIGIYTAITVFLEQMLCPWGYEDFFAGVVCGTCLVLGGVVGGLIAGVIADRTKRFTLISKLSYFFCIGSVAFFTFIHNKRSQEALIALSCALIGFFGLPLFPLGNELVVETTYPVEVATSSGLVFLSGQLQGMLLILVLQKLATPVAPEFANITKCHSSDSSVSPAGGMTKPIPIRDMTISSYALFGYSAFVCLIFLVFFRTTYRRRNMEQTSSRRKSYLRSADILEDNDVGNMECISPNFDSKNAVDVRHLPSTSLDDSSTKTSKPNF